MAGKRTKKVRLPEPRGRRGHKAVNEQPGLRDWLKERLLRRPRPTLDEIMQELKGTAYAVGRTAVWEFEVAFELEKARLEHVLDLAKKFNATIESSEILDVETAIANFGSTKLFDELLAKAGEPSGLTVADMLTLFSKLQSSSSQRERTKFAVDRGVKRTAAHIRREMQELLQKQPDLLKRMLAVVDQAAAEARR